MMLTGAEKALIDECTDDGVTDPIPIAAELADKAVADGRYDHDEPGGNESLVTEYQLAVEQYIRGKA